MNFGSVRTLTLDVNFSVHGLDVTVTLPNEEPVEARMIWLAPDTSEAPPGAAFARQEPRRILAFRRSEVPIVPRGTRVLAPAHAGGVTKVWVVDGADRQDADHHRFIVVLDPTQTADLAGELAE